MKVGDITRTRTPGMQPMSSLTCSTGKRSDQFVVMMDF